MDVEIETEDGSRFKQEIWFFATVLEIKEVIQKYHGFPISRQILVFNGNVLEDEHDAHHYEILEGSRILLQLKKEPPPPPTTTTQEREKEPAPETKRHQKQSQNREHALKTEYELAAKTEPEPAPAPEHEPEQAPAPEHEPEQASEEMSNPLQETPPKPETK